MDVQVTWLCLLWMFFLVVACVHGTHELSSFFCRNVFFSLAAHTHVRKRDLNSQSWHPSDPSWFVFMTTWDSRTLVFRRNVLFALAAHTHVRKRDLDSRTSRPSDPCWFVFLTTWDSQTLVFCRNVLFALAPHAHVRKWDLNSRSLTNHDDTLY